MGFIIHSQKTHMHFHKNNINFIDCVLRSIIMHNVNCKVYVPLSAIDNKLFSEHWNQQYAAVASIVCVFNTKLQRADHSALHAT